MEIRRTLPEDARAIAAAEAEIFSNPYGEDFIISLLSTEGAMCYTALSDGKICAYILGRLIAPEGEIYRVGTLPEYRRHGIATRMLTYAIKTEKGRGLESLFLEVRTKNEPARTLYKSLGFTEIGIRKNYYKNPTDDAIVMHLASEES